MANIQPIPPPESIVNLAWVMSGKYSKNTEEQEDAQEAETYFQTITKQIQTAFPAYAGEITSLLLGNKRTFSLIVRHRDYIFDRIEVEKKNKVNMYQQLQSFSGSLQGIFPRLAGIAIGGTTLPLLISQVYPSLPPATSTLLLVAFGGIGYIVAEIISAHIGGSKLNENIERYEIEKDNVYDEFLNKSRLALRLLFDNLIESYKLTNVDTAYDRNLEQRNKILDDIMKAAMRNE